MLSITKSQGAMVLGMCLKVYFREYDRGKYMKYARVTGTDYGLGLVQMRNR